MYRQEYYLDNRDKWLHYNRGVRARLKSWYNEMKTTWQCLHCGDRTDIELHHPDPSLKEYNVSDMVVRGYARERILNEISKCIPLCERCHAKITYHDG